MNDQSSWRPPRTIRWINAGLRGIERYRDLVKFDEASLLADAAKQAQTSEFGNDRFLVPLRALLRSYESDRRLTPIGRLISRSTLVYHAANRMRNAQQYRARPEILNEQIRQPLFVLGLPRTGTTLLYNLLAQDETARPLLFWESMRPAPHPASKTHREDPRIAEAEKKVKSLNFAAPGMKSIHDFQARGPEECLGLLYNTFLTPFFRGDVPEYRAWLYSLPNEEIDRAYVEYREQLQLLQTQRSGGHWLLKCPSHLFGLGSLLKTFPDARVVQTHRNLEESIPSLCSLSATLDGLIYQQVDEAHVGRRILTLMQQMIDRSMTARNDRTDQRLLDVNYHQLKADPLATIQNIYSHFGLEWTAAGQNRMQKYLDTHRQAQHGAHHYSLAQFGISSADLDERFEAYHARFLRS